MPIQNYEAIQPNGPSRFPESDPFLGVRDTRRYDVYFIDQIIDCHSLIILTLGRDKTQRHLAGEEKQPG